MSVKGKSVVHCHGKNKGKKIATLASPEEALAMHRAIMANKRKRKESEPVNRWKM